MPVLKKIETTYFFDWHLKLQINFHFCFNQFHWYYANFVKNQIMIAVQKNFPVASTYIYANTASSCIFSEDHLDFRQDHDLDLFIGGSLFRDKQVQLITGVRQAVAKFFNGNSKHVALVPNFSIGLNMLLEGLDKSKKVLLLSTDYPSINWPVESRGFKVCYAEITAEVEANIQQQFETEKPEVFIFSIVQFLDGVKLDLEFIKTLKSQYPDVLFIADGTQYFGTETFDFSASGIDVIGSSAYKWMLGGYGCGFFMFSDAAEKVLQTKTIGFNSALGRNDKSLVNLVNQLEPGHWDTLPYCTMQFGLEYLAKLGLDKIEEHLQQLSEKFIAGLQRSNLLPEIVANRKQHSTIFTLDGGEKLHQYLKSKDIITSLRDGKVRISFFIYNTEKDVSKVLDALRKFHA